ncbi:MAG: hypothetical protein ACREMP_02470 [Candidatus Tyrphobacter sp.]
MRHGFLCEECEVAIFPTTTRAELAWLRDRAHVAREVARHSGTGLDQWMMEGLAFLEEHGEHGVTIVERRM